MKKSARITLVNAAFRFLLTVTPLHSRSSRSALQAFLAAAQECWSPSPEADIVLIRSLTTLARHTRARIPSAVDAYLWRTGNFEECLTTFADCIEEMLAEEGVGDPMVQAAVKWLGRHFCRSDISPTVVAEALGVPSARLRRSFKSVTGQSVTDYIRRLRLERSAQLLATTRLTIKQVWAAVGYNHPSNYNHDFKRWSGLNPHEFRAWTIASIPECSSTSEESLGTVSQRPASPLLLLADPCDVTRECLARRLRSDGYSVVEANTGGRALAQAERHAPQMVLVEYDLNDLDALEFLRRLRQAAPGAGAAAAVITADWDAIDKKDEIAAFEATVVVKLCDLGAITRLVNPLQRASSVDVTKLVAFTPPKPFEDRVLGTGVGHPQSHPDLTE